MMSEVPSLSLALLMYNEEANIARTLDETLAFCVDTVEEFEIIVVDDGSTDSSADIVRDYLARDARVRLVSHEVNRGMGAGIRTAIESATMSYFIFNAADGQIAASEIGKLFCHLTEADIVLSTYDNMRESLGRELLSRAFRVYLRLVAGIGFALQGLYLFPTEAAKSIAPLIEANTFFFSFEFIKRGMDQGLTVTTTEMTCRPRSAGASKVTNLARITTVGKEALRFGLRNKRFIGANLIK
jgi:glycosyltransferase involved in cell wall biosynthesis